MILINCVGNPQDITREDINIILTRGREYLIFFGDYDLWKQTHSPLQNLLNQAELSKERMVLFS
jgi:hypothetical protein